MARTDKEQILKASGWEDMEAAEAALTKSTPDPKAEKSIRSTIGYAQFVCIVGLGGIFVMALSGML